MFSRIILLLLISSYTQLSHAQEIRKYLAPEYKIKYRDTNGTYLQVQNYFDRSYYAQEIYLLQEKENERYTTNLFVDTISGLADASKREDQLVDIRINKCFEIKAVKIKKGSITKIEIREGNGALTLILDQACRKDTGSILAQIIQDKDTQIAKVPSAFFCPIGNYKVIIKTIPEQHFTYYARPSEIKQKIILEPVVLNIANREKLAELKMEASSYPSKKFYPCFRTQQMSELENLYVMPKKLYHIYYRKKNKKRFKKQVFYARPCEYYKKILE